MPRRGKGTTQHYFSKNPPVSGRRFEFRLEISGRCIKFASSNGVFSKDRVDRGTIVLISSLVLPERGEVLDMGCGIGVVGIAVAGMRPKLRVTMVDINPLAVKLALENIEDNRISNAESFQSDLYSNLDGRLFDTVVSNPPLAAGYKIIFPLIEGAFAHLKDGGSLQLVLRKGVNAIPKKMNEIFGNVELISRQSGYKVFRSIKNGS